MSWKPFICCSLLFEFIAAQLAFTMSAAFVAKLWTAGSDTMNITWAGAEGPVTLQLMGGKLSNLVIIQVIACLPLSIDNYSYVPPVTIPDRNYTLEILDTTGQYNYEKPFNITGEAPATTSSSPSQSTSASAPSASNTPASTTPNPSTSNSPQPHNSFSTGDKAAIGVGSALGAWHGRRSAKKNEKLLSEQSPTSPSHGALASPYPPSHSPDTARAMRPELGAGEPRSETIASTVRKTRVLSEDEKKELQSRRRAAELEGSLQKVVPGVVSERAELEARRKGVSWETSELSF